MRRKVWLTVFVGGALLTIVIVVVATRFSLFEAELKEITVIDVPGDEGKIGIYFVPSNATSQDYIQIRKIGVGQDDIIMNFERFDFVVKSSFINDSLLEIVLKDTSAYITKQDTFIVNVN